jgi:hypothetical protein
MERWSAVGEDVRVDYVGGGARAAVGQRLERLGLARWWGCVAAVGVTVGLGLFRLGSRSLWGRRSTALPPAFYPARVLPVRSPGR